MSIFKPISIECCFTQPLLLYSHKRIKGSVCSFSFLTVFSQRLVDVMDLSWVGLLRVADTLNSCLPLSQRNVRIVSSKFLNEANRDLFVVVFARRVQSKGILWGLCRHLSGEPRKDRSGWADAFADDVSQATVEHYFGT